ncbi:hypothetical protein [Janthinobacterium sp. 17J80-10]|uniref:hypothetical protein n=1 Tax=Janthinobacterium sp. 17J80-10 TaxID=2497863 RepID=UPI0013E8C07C|nr:hypothetical protein [Janthinobacterium sp. 17J80-10]
MDVVLVVVVIVVEVVALVVEFVLEVISGIRLVVVTAVLLAGVSEPLPVLVPPVAVEAPPPPPQPAHRNTEAMIAAACR